jgi:hypothetical protein
MDLCFCVHLLDTDGLSGEEGLQAKAPSSTPSIKAV